MVDLQSGRPSELLAFPPVGWTQQDVHTFTTALHGHSKPQFHITGV